MVRLSVVNNKTKKPHGAKETMLRRMIHQCIPCPIRVFRVPKQFPQFPQFRSSRYLPRKERKPGEQPDFSRIIDMMGNVRLEAAR